MEFAPNSRVANNLRESAQTSAMEAGSIFIQNVLQSMARELAKMGIDLTPEAE